MKITGKIVGLVPNTPTTYVAEITLIPEGISDMQFMESITVGTEFGFETNEGGELTDGN